MSTSDASGAPRVPAPQLALRFALELAALVALGKAAARHVLAPAWLSWAAALGVPLVAAALWATFAVPGDPSRSGRAPVPVPGAVRLALELAVFAGGLAALVDLRTSWWSGAFAAGLVVHHAGTLPRLAWLVRQRPR